MHDVIIVILSPVITALFCFPSDSFDRFEGLNDNNNNNNNNVTLDRTNIAWSTDRSIRFRNPEGRNNVSFDDLKDTIMPPNWPRSLAEIGNGLQNESLMVWYRVAAFPWFKKLYGRPSVNGVQSESLPAGNYTITLTYSILAGRRGLGLEVGAGEHGKLLIVEVETDSGEMREMCKVLARALNQLHINKNFYYE